MDKRIKILLISLGVVSLFAVVIAAWIYFSAQAEFVKYLAKQTEIEEKNTSLQKTLETHREEARRWQEKAQEVTGVLNKLSQEHALLQVQYTPLLEQRNSLAQENRSLGAEVERLNKLYAEAQEKAQEKVEAGIDTSDAFLASLLEEKAVLEVRIENLRSKLRLQEAQFEDAEKQIGSIERLQKERRILEKKLQDAQSVSDLLSNDLLKERKKRAELEEQLVKTGEQLKTIIQEKIELSNQFANMRKALEQRLAQLNMTRQILEGAVEDAKIAAKKAETTSIQLPPIIVRAEQEGLSAPRLSRAGGTGRTRKLSGRIVTVNDKHRFVVIDIGRDNGVENGMGFDVYRQGKKVGRIEAIETRKNIAACDIRQMSVRSLKTSDTIRR